MVTVLQLNRLELKEMINQEIVENPVLEESLEEGEEITPEELQPLSKPSGRRIRPISLFSMRPISNLKAIAEVARNTATLLLNAEAPADGVERGCVRRRGDLDHGSFR